MNEKINPQKIVLLLSILMDGPMRHDKLLESTNRLIKSPSDFEKLLKYLIENSFVERIEKSHKNIEYQISPKALHKNTKLMNTASRLSTLGSYEMIKEAMDFLVDNSSAFATKEEAIETAIDFWISAYNKLCTWNALLGLLAKKDQDSIMTVRIYQARVEKLLELVLRFKAEHNGIEEFINERLKENYLWRSSQMISSDVHQFLEAHNPKSLEKTDISKLEDKLYSIEKETQQFVKCVKLKENVPRWCCAQDFCRDFRKARKNKKHLIPEDLRMRKCMFEEAVSVREKNKLNLQATDDNNYKTRSA
jgi:hypothetical protein